MDRESISEKVPVVPLQVSGSSPKRDYKQNSDIRRKRLIVLVLLTIQLAFGLFYFIQRTVELVKYYKIPVDQRDGRLAGSYIGNLVVAILSVIYVAIFIFVVAKCYRIPILIFAWLGILQLVWTLIIIILAIVAVVTVSTVLHGTGVGIASGIVIIVLAVLSCIITILIIVFSFKLAKLLKMHEAYQFV